MTVVLASVRFSRQWQILITSLKHVGITDTSLTLHQCMCVGKIRPIVSQLILQINKLKFVFPLSFVKYLMF